MNADTDIVKAITPAIVKMTEIQINNTSMMVKKVSILMLLS